MIRQDPFLCPLSQQTPGERRSSGQGERRQLWEHDEHLGWVWAPWERCLALLASSRLHWSVSRTEAGGPTYVWIKSRGMTTLVSPCCSKSKGTLQGEKLRIPPMILFCKMAEILSGNRGRRE